MGMKEKLGGSLKRSARIVPGIGSYQDKESIRESDKKLREFLSSQLLDQIKTIERMKTGIARSGSLLFLNDLDHLARKIDKLCRSVEFASRGYTPVFDSDQADEDALQKLYDFDTALKQDIDQVELLVEKIGEKADQVDQTSLKELEEYLIGIEKRMGERERLLKK